MKPNRFKKKPVASRRLIIVAMFAGLVMLNPGCEQFDFFNNSDFVSSGSSDGDIARVVIGRGYDISERFAYSENIKSSVLDFTKLTTDKKVIKDGNISQTEVTVKEGNTISEYQMSFDYAHTGSAGLDGLFSAEVGYNFGYDRAKRSDYSYATVSSYTSKYGIYVDGRKNPSTLSDYVSNQFLSDAESMDMDKLIDTYGTHIIVGGIWGASLDFSMSAQRKSVSNTYSFGAFVSAEATIEGISLGGSTEISSEFSNYYESSTKKFTINAKGGNSEHALSIITASTPEGRDNAYAAWVQTIDGNPSFCNYYEGGLVPIYDFIEDEDTKSMLKTGIEEYLDSRGIESVELIEKVIVKNFEIKDFCQNVGQGDSNVDCDGNGTINTEVNFIVDVDMNNDLTLSVTMKVHEMKGDYTKLEGTKEQRMYTNENINSIDLQKTEFGFNLDIPFDLDNNAYYPVSMFPEFVVQEFVLPSWLKNVMICVDGNTKDDTHVIGVKGTLNVPVIILP